MGFGQGSNFPENSVENTSLSGDAFPKSYENNMPEKMKCGFFLHFYAFFCSNIINWWSLVQQRAYPASDSSQ